MGRPCGVRSSSCNDALHSSLCTRLNMSVSLALHAHVTTAATLVCNTPCSALHSTAQMNGSQAEQQLPGPAAQSLLVQLLLLLSMLYLGILCRFNLAWVLSAACTVVCAVAAWQWLSKVCWITLTCVGKMQYQDGMHIAFQVHTWDGVMNAGKVCCPHTCIKNKRLSQHTSATAASCNPRTQIPSNTQSDRDLDQG